MISISTPSQETALSSLGDDVTQLRQWSSDRAYALPEPPVLGWIIGASIECALQLSDGGIAPRHAELLHERHQWRIRSLTRATPLRQDGERCLDVVLAPGVEVGIGTLTLIAESPRSMALRAFCSRLLGWGSDRMRAVDHALRAIRSAVAHRSLLLLQGDEDMVPIARALHRYMLGPEAPFILCDRRRRNTSASVRSPANHGSTLAAYEAAASGTLCVRASRLPKDLVSLLQLFHEPDSRVLLIICMDRHMRGSFVNSPLPIEIPSLAIREAELPRIIDEYANDAIAELDAQAECFSERDRGWVIQNSARSLSEVEKATRRIVAIKASANQSRAAELLGLAPVSLARWFERRPPLRS